MNKGLASIDRLIKEKISFTENSSDLNPFYITKKEIEELIDTENGEEELEGIYMLKEILGLNQIETDILMLLFAFEVYPKYEKIFAFLHDDLNKKYPTISLISYLFFKNSFEVLKYFSEDYPLRKYGIIKISNGVESEVPIIHLPVRLEESVKNFIIGNISVDKNIRTFVEIIPPAQNPEIKNKSLENNIKVSENRFILNLYGKNNFEKQNYALNLSSLKKYGLFIVDSLLFEEQDNLEINLKKLFRDAFLNGCNLFFSNFDYVLKNEKRKNILKTIKNEMQIFSWMVFFDTENPFSFNLDGFTFLDKKFDFPEKEDSLKIWKKYLNIDGYILKEITNEFHFDESQIKNISNQIKSKIGTGEKLTKRDIYNICRRVSSKDLDLFSQKLETLFTFEDIVLPEDSLNKLKSIINHHRNSYEIFYKWGFKDKYPNQNVSVLFTGSPGTGKTMAASVLGNELQLDVYRIDLSKVISKYIGETEKNLSKIFSSAENSGVILFFDEADSIFGKRTEIKDSHDRYANIEVSYLLQRIEDYRGIVILATNFKKNIDEAFLRRIRFVVDFPNPDEEMRYKIWKKAFPQECPVSKDVDFKFFAKNFKFSGANIKNAALYSAFIAFEKNSEINQEHILEGIKLELQKTGKNIKNIDNLILSGEEDENLV